MQANSGKVFNNFTWIAMVAVMAVLFINEHLVLFMVV